MFTSTTKKRSLDQKQITRNLGKSERILDHRDLRKQMVILTRASLAIVIAVMHMLPPHILPHPGGVIVELGDAFIKLRHATPLRHVARRRRRRQAPGRRERRPAKSQVSPRHSSCRNLKKIPRNRTARLGHRRRQRQKPRGAAENNLNAAPNANFRHSHGKLMAAKPWQSAGRGYSARKAFQRALCTATLLQTNDIISVRKAFKKLLMMTTVVTNGWNEPAAMHQFRMRPFKPFWGWTKNTSSPAQGFWFFQPLLCPKVFPTYLPTSSHFALTPSPKLGIGKA